MRCNAAQVTAAYALYLQQRKAGLPRRYFSNRAHALYFLRKVAPTKLVDGAWLYGLLGQAADPRFGHLIATYIEELGGGDADKNHVLLYRKLLAGHGIDIADDHEDAACLQGLIQLSLAWCAGDFLPEIIGFNLGYEQLPLHLLITAYELNELGIDPYYFQLHVTVDNADTGHARRACQAVAELMPRLCDGGAFWQRVRNGSRLGEAGLGTTQAIAGFDIDAEVLRIFVHKCQAGRGAHSDYCRVAGRSINDWLGHAEQMPAFLDALRDAGWIKLGEPVAHSRFWCLLQGERAEMFGVFSAYELQVVHDWIRGAASADGRSYDQAAPVPARCVGFRVAERLRTARAVVGPADASRAGFGLTDPDLALLQQTLPALDDGARLQLLTEAMSPAQHWTPAGLHATRVFRAQARL